MLEERIKKTKTDFSIEEKIRNKTVNSSKSK